LQISNKCYYALRAVFELALHYGSSTPVKIGYIAARQRIPKRFLEVILNELRQGGFVESRRGVEGGYLLARKPEEISIGDIVRFVDGDLSPVSCVPSNGQQPVCELDFQCPFYDFWLRIRDTIVPVYDGTSMADIVENWNNRAGRMSLNYEI